MEEIKNCDMTKYREKIMNEICKSGILVKLLCEADAGQPENIIPYKRCFPYEYIPDTMNETDRFINYEISETADSKNNLYKNLTISFFIAGHQNVVLCRENGMEYLWYDIAACELEKLFCNKNVLGIGAARLTSNEPYRIQNKSMGRLLKFTVRDFNNGLKYGK
ncbi:MAG: hypothetical protein J6C64_00615 [Lachnospiraceae bacterium]|nr:hypothetical protein [Lachnospiraceae bacterium]